VATCDGGENVFDGDDRRNRKKINDAKGQETERRLMMPRDKTQKVVGS
jgi:hypothetical protein